MERARRYQEEVMAHTFAHLAEHLTGAIVAIEIWQHEILEHSGKMVEKEAKRVIGTYDYGWPQLAESTQAERSRLGYPPNKPLLREGDLRDSIEHTVDGKHCFVGSNSDIAVYQELGTVRVPPRSFLVRAAMEKEHQIHEEISKGIAVVVGGAMGLRWLGG